MSSSSSQEVAVATPLGKETHTETDWIDEETRAAMDWFKSFYVTKAMIKVGYKVMKPDYDLAYRRGVRPVKYSGEYKEDEEAHENYKKALEEWEAERQELVLDEDQKKEHERYRPLEPLSPAAWSFRNGPNEDYECMMQISKFDRITLTNIILAYTDDKDRESVMRRSPPSTHSELMNEVDEVIQKNEADMAEMNLKYHPAMELVSGVLCKENWQWLSISDLEKWARACGAFICYSSRESMVRHILNMQVELFDEIISKGDQGDDCRGYNSIRARNQDNKRSLFMQTNIEDEPKENLRKKLTEASQTMHQLWEHMSEDDGSLMMMKDYCKDLLALVPRDVVHEHLIKKYGNILKMKRDKRKSNYDETESPTKKLCLDDDDDDDDHQSTEYQNE